MGDPISIASPETETAAPPETGTEEPVSGNGQPAGEASQSATGSESFIPEGVDLNTLPPQVRAYVDSVNKQMVRGFTEKTTKLAETTKAEAAKLTAAFKDKADWYDTALKDPELVKTINEYVNRRASAADPSKVNVPPEIQEKLEKIDHLEREFKMTQAQESVSAFAEAKDEKGNLMHPEFDRYHSIIIGTHPQAGEYSLLRAAIELAPGNSAPEKLANGYKAIDSAFKAIFDEGKKAGMGRLQEKARNGSMAPSSVHPGSMAPRQPKNALEALEFARQGLSPHTA